MQRKDKTIITALFNVEVLASFAMLVGMLINFGRLITGYIVGSGYKGIDPYGFFMLAMTFISILILLHSSINNKGTLFIWLAVFYVLFAFTSTVLSGIYPVRRLPMRFVELFYWVVVMILSYYSVLSLNTTKFHIAIVVLMLPFLSYKFHTMRYAVVAYQGFLLLNPVFFISFLMPVVLLLRHWIVRASGMLLIFVAIVLSYKRMAILGFLTSILVYFYYLSKTGLNIGLRKVINVFMAAVIFMVVTAFSFRYLVTVERLDWAARMSDIIIGGGAGRLDFWREVFSALAMQPPDYWLFGHGYRSLPLELSYWAHNDFVEILYEFGLLGLTFYLMFVGKIFSIFFKMKRFGYRHVPAFAVSLVWYFWGAMTDVFINHPYWSLGIALFWGITIADFENAKRQKYISEMEESSYIYQYCDGAVADVPYA